MNSRCKSNDKAGSLKPYSMSRSSKFNEEFQLISLLRVGHSHLTATVHRRHVSIRICLSRTYTMPANYRALRLTPPFPHQADQDW